MSAICVERWMRLHVPTFSPFCGLMCQDPLLIREKLFQGIDKDYNVRIFNTLKPTLNEKWQFWNFFDTTWRFDLSLNNLKYINMKIRINYLALYDPPFCMRLPRNGSVEPKMKTLSLKIFSPIFCVVVHTVEMAGRAPKCLCPSDWLGFGPARCMRSSTNSTDNQFWTLQLN